MPRQGMSAAAVMRAAVLPPLEDEPSCAMQTATTSNPQVAAVAPTFPKAAMSAASSTVWHPTRLPPDHAHAVAAMVGSTDQPAVISVDLNAFMRLLGRGKSAEIERYRAGVVSLADDAWRHPCMVAPRGAERRSAKRLHSNDQRAVPRIGK